jgi:EAL and modified HD-GYP domain-containing signal transduction protein
MSETWIGRQPIFDRALATYGYELLFRRPGGHTAEFVSGTAATAQVIVAALADVGIDRIVGGTMAFFNITRGFVVGQYPVPLAPGQVVLELLEDIQSDREVELGVDRLKQQGFRIALDDVVSVEPAQVPLFERADVVKVECLGRSRDELARVVDQLRPFDVELLAEKLETPEELETCKALGFDYFQGYFLERPEILKARALTPSRLQLLRLVTELQSPHVSFERVEEIARVEMALSMKLLACVNAATYGLRRRIDTVRDALVILGVNKVRNIVTLLLLARISDKPSELITLAITRARMCENVAARQGRLDKAAAFTVGMFSLLDALLDQPMERVLQDLPLGTATRAALLHRTGELGALLNAVIGYERGHWADAERGIGAELRLQECFLEAVAWSRDVRRELANAA